eukprot:12885980-Heterocapsa_arctica.AAC.1
MHKHELPIAVASDSQADTMPNAGCLRKNGERTGAWCTMTAEHLQAWGSHSKGWRMDKIQFMLRGGNAERLIMKQGPEVLGAAG